MKPSRCALIAALVAAGAANVAAAQSTALVPEPSAPLVLTAPPATTLSGTPAAPLAAVQPASRAYLRNEADTPAAAVENRIHPAAFGTWRTDPKLVAGFELTPNLALEAGYANLYDRGTFFADGTHPEDVAGALGVKGYNSYLAAKVAIPVSERLHAYGKAGVASSQLNRHGLLNSAGIIEPGTQKQTFADPDTGPYVGAGAEYKLNDKASVSGAYQRYGDSAKWGAANSNNNGVSAKLKLGF